MIVVAIAMSTSLRVTGGTGGVTVTGPDVALAVLNEAIRARGKQDRP